MLVDDHALLRDALKIIIMRNPRFEVVAEAGNVREALKIAQKRKPDILLVDISLPDRSGIQFVREVRRFLPKARIMIVSMHTKMDFIAEAFQVGALGYVIKESASDTLLEGLAAIAKGDKYLDTNISSEVIKKLMVQPTAESRIVSSSYKTLTNREQEVMRMLAEGVKGNDIAKKFCISPRTVANHRASIMKKLDIHDSFGFYRYATKLGLIDVDLLKS